MAVGLTKEVIRLLRDGEKTINQLFERSQHADTREKIASCLSKLKSQGRAEVVGVTERGKNIWALDTAPREHLLRKSWSEAEDVQMLDWLDEGLTVRQIADRLGRTVLSVRRRLQRVNGPCTDLYGGDERLLKLACYTKWTTGAQP